MRAALFLIPVTLPLVIPDLRPPPPHSAGASIRATWRSLDGSGNNRRHPEWGQAGSTYPRLAPANYADRAGTMIAGPPARYVSNRVFNDTSQNLFSENGLTQWGFVWGQFLDHTFGLRQEGDEAAPIRFDTSDPLEEFINDDGAIAFTRSAAAASRRRGTLEQVNVVGGYLDASAVYGDTAERLEWLRDGPVDGDLFNNSATLLLPNGLLPRRDARGDATTAPRMTLTGPLAGDPAAAVVAGDVRANENLALTAVQTLFAREHNRIVALLPAELPEADKFEIARRVVGAEQQFITYEEFLPAVGVSLAPASKYDPRRNASVTNQFATVGFRAHSMVHGELESTAAAADYSAEQLAAIEAVGVEVVVAGEELEFVIPLNVAFGNPGLLGLVGLDAVLVGLGAESQYRNDEQIDNQMRSVLFQPPAATDPACLDGPMLPQCYRLVSDLGAIDVERGRDHGIAAYNDLRRALGLEPRSAFTEITGEASEAFPADPELDVADPLQDPNLLDVLELFDAADNPIEPGSEAADGEAVTAIRRTTLAARLAALYGDVDSLDAFVGMVAEPHLPGSELGELQHAMWARQFEALRDGDRFFYLWDPLLAEIEQRYGITFRHTLAGIIELNSGADVADNVFRAAT